MNKSRHSFYGHDVAISRINHLVMKDSYFEIPFEKAPVLREKQN